MKFFLMNGEVYIETGNGLRKLHPHEKDILLDDDYWKMEVYDYD